MLALASILFALFCLILLCIPPRLHERTSPGKITILIPSNQATFDD